jgi:hypothetical protein
MKLILRKKVGRVNGGESVFRDSVMARQKGTAVAADPHPLGALPASIFSKNTLFSTVKQF